VQAAEKRARKEIVVGMSTCNIAAGSQDVYDLVQERVAGGLDADVKITGCFGMCFSEPQVQVIDEDGTVHLYTGVSKARIKKILDSHVEGGEPMTKWAANFAEGEDLALMGKQKRIVLNTWPSTATRLWRRCSRTKRAKRSSRR
jgi:(2Fe-2S) ferredoxin